MREILFRGKRVGGFDWAYGCYYKQSAFYGDPVEVHNIITSQEDLEYDMAMEYTSVVPETVGQFTGLTDKNGTKIFEGDIVDASDEWWDAYGPAGHSSPFLVVEFDEGFCGFTPFVNYDCDCGVYISPGGCEIIGNIHDNPELIEK
jgi:uncharacterized phage protein (TIGR01671 family)